MKIPKKNSCRGNYMRKYGRYFFPLRMSFATFMTALDQFQILNIMFTPGYYNKVSMNMQIRFRKVSHFLINILAWFNYNYQVQINKQVHRYLIFLHCKTNFMLIFVKCQNLKSLFMFSLLGRLKKLGISMWLILICCLTNDWLCRGFASFKTLCSIIEFNIRKSKL